MGVQQTVGILAYGSLIPNPGKEIEGLRIRVIKDIETPFPIEFARSSNQRGGCPTLVPVEKGGTRVKGQVFVMDSTEKGASNVLYRREINNFSNGKIYVRPKKVKSNSVLVERIVDFAGLDVVLYTKIAANIDPLTAEILARLAIESVAKADRGRDGISYLVDAKKFKTETALSQVYENEILRLVKCKSLEEALEKLTTTQPPSIQI